MDNKQRQHYKHIILAKREVLLRQLDQLKVSGLNNAVRDESGDHSSYTLHMADQGTDTMEREKQYMFASREQNYLYHLDLALERVDTEEFGICVSCGKPIGPERLEAAPHVRLCIDCKKKEELTKRT